MKLRFTPKTKLEKFGFTIAHAIVENFPKTFFVGGMVRDLLLKRKILDIDIATSATPQEVQALLSAQGYTCDMSAKPFGVVRVSKNNITAEVTTLRKDSYQGKRFPKVTFVKTPKEDSKRRDFTINSLYLQVKDHTLLDYCGGIKDLNSKKIKSIGDANISMQQDPLRIIRALRFAYALQFSIEKKTYNAMVKNKNLLQTISQTRITKEIQKEKNKLLRKKIIYTQKNLDTNSFNS